MNKLTSATNDLHKAEELIDAALGQLKEIDSPWLAERITELLTVSDQLGDTVGQFDDILDLVGVSDG